MGLDMLTNEFYARQINPDVPNIILNGLSSAYLYTDPKTKEDIYTNVYGHYSISDTPEGKIVKADYFRNPAYYYLPKEWKLEEEGAVPIICHRPSKCIGKETDILFRGENIYENDQGLYYVVNKQEGKTVIPKYEKHFYDSFSMRYYYHPYQWLLVEDYLIDVAYDLD